MICPQNGWVVDHHTVLTIVSIVYINTLSCFYTVRGKIHWVDHANDNPINLRNVKVLMKRNFCRIFYCFIKRYCSNDEE
jgi:hypothetical protein